MRTALIVALALFVFSLPASAALTAMNASPANGNALETKNAHIDVRVLAPNVAETHTVPSFNGTKAGYVLFSSTADFYIQMDGTAAIPSSDVTDGSGSDLRPMVRWLHGDVSTISLISPTDAVVTMIFYR